MKVVWSVVAVVAVVACRKRVPELTTPTVEEATAFANEFVKHMVPCDRTAVTRDFDIDVLVRRVTAGRKGFEERQVAMVRAGWSQALVETLCRHYAGEQAAI